MSKYFDLAAECSSGSETEDNTSPTQVYSDMEGVTSDSDSSINLETQPWVDPFVTPAQQVAPPLKVRSKVKRNSKRNFSGHRVGPRRDGHAVRRVLVLDSEDSDSDSDLEVLEVRTPPRKFQRTIVPQQVLQDDHDEVNPFLALDIECPPNQMALPGYEADVFDVVDPHSITTTSNIRHNVPNPSPVAAAPAAAPLQGLPSDEEEEPLVPLPPSGNLLVVSSEDERGSQCKFVCFTWNNPPVAPADLLTKLEETKDRAGNACIVYLKFQKELSSTGTEHYQGYLELARSRAFSFLKKLMPGAHLEKRKGTRQACIDYCSKEETRIDGPWGFGDIPVSQQGKRNDIHNFAASILSNGIVQAREENPGMFMRYHAGAVRLAAAVVRQDFNLSTRQVILLIGPAGCGKTYFYYTAEGLDAYAVPPSGGFWFDGWEGQEAALIDEYTGFWTLAQTLQVTDRYNIRLPVKGGFTVWNPRRIYITTNIHPYLWYEWHGRAAQRAALKRRFTKVIHWNSTAAMAVHTPDNVAQWDYFWGFNRTRDEVTADPMSMFDF